MLNLAGAGFWFYFMVFALMCLGTMVLSYFTYNPTKHDERVRKINEST